jgi:hypothetical protein
MPVNDPFWGMTCNGFGALVPENHRPIDIDHEKGIVLYFLLFAEDGRFFSERGSKEAGQIAYGEGNSDPGDLYRPVANHIQPFLAW